LNDVGFAVPEDFVGRNQVGARLAMAVDSQQKEESENEPNKETNSVQGTSHLSSSSLRWGSNIPAREFVHISIVA
jgi:hypothetical protein